MPNSSKNEPTSGATDSEAITAPARTTVVPSPASTSPSTPAPSSPHSSAPSAAPACAPAPSSPRPPSPSSSSAAPSSAASAAPPSPLPAREADAAASRLPWRAHPFAELVRLAWPIAVATVSFTIMTLVDTVIVGHLGTAELAGVGLAGMAAFFLICFPFGLLAGGKVLVSQAIGAGRRDEVLRYVAVALGIAVALGVCVLGITELAALGIGRLAATPATGDAARRYMQVRAFGAPAVLVQVALREILQAQGNARAPMVSTLIANVVNLFLALLFVFVLHMGVAGAALASVLAVCVEAGVVLRVQYTLGGFGLWPMHATQAPTAVQSATESRTDSATESATESRTDSASDAQIDSVPHPAVESATGAHLGSVPHAQARLPLEPRPQSGIVAPVTLASVLARAYNRTHVAQLVRIGLPTGLQFMLELGSFTTLTLAVATFSEVDMAAHQIALQLIHFSFMPCVAVGEAAAVLAGQAVGADRDDLVPYVGRRALVLALVYAGLCSIVFLTAGRLIANAFTTDVLVIALVARLLRLAGLFQLFDAVNIISRSVLRGTGDVRFAAIVGVTVAWCCTPTLAWGLGHGLRMGAFGGWLGIAFEVLFSCIIMGLRVERRGWARAAAASRARLREHDPKPVSDYPSRPDLVLADSGS